MISRKFSWLLVFLSAFAGLAHATDWTVSKVSQPSRFTVDRKTWQPLQAGMTIPNKSWISTGPRGRVVLQRNKDKVTFGPGTMAGVYEKAGLSLHTDFAQQSGTLQLEIDPQVKPHLAVQTPYLAAVVKGTRFTVSVNRKGGASVGVDRGRVEVTDPASGERTGIKAGQRASVDTNPHTGMALTGKNRNFEAIEHVTPFAAMVPAPPGAVPAVAPAKGVPAAKATKAAVADTADTTDDSQAETDATNNGKTTSTGTGTGKSADTGKSEDSNGHTGKSGKDTSGKGSSGKGNSGKGNSGKGNSGKGSSGKGESGDSDGKSDSGKGDSKGHSGKGNSGKGDSKGDSGKGHSKGDSGKGDSKGDSGKGDSKGDSGEGDSDSDGDHGSDSGGKGNSGNSGKGNGGNSGKGSSGNSGKGSSGNGHGNDD